MMLIKSIAVLALLSNAMMVNAATVCKFPIVNTSAMKQVVVFVPKQEAKRLDNIMVNAYSSMAMDSSVTEHDEKGSCMNIVEHYSIQVQNPINGRMVTCDEPVLSDVMPSSQLVITVIAPDSNSKTLCFVRPN